ncbi:tetratricopeptide repeat-containing diguanylate cyclase [Pseudidiomarina homiensis]|uniref:tetratricopeptide repeat-containing diguanylate cyclase n=1 Tax=Pseudidiomarina homiensis TaxID=364198 RepID=UPI00215B3C23|nr:GGDEF domain-containing protein [Pseudidiomarina homiensis]
MITLLLFWGGTFAHAQTQIPLATASNDDIAPPQLDANLEAELDRLLIKADSEQAMLEQMQELRQNLDDDTAPMSRVRLLSYIALSFTYLDQVDKAYDLIDKAEIIARDSGLPDAQAEVAATRILIKNIEGKLTEAYTLINTATVHLEQAQLPRVRYFANNLIGSIYLEKNNTERALEHLIAASTAVNETDDERTPIRRIFLKLRIAEIYNKQKLYEQAIEQIDSAEAIMNEAGLEAMYGPEITFLRAVTATEQGLYDQAFDIYSQLERDIKNDPDWGYMQTSVLNNLGDLAIRTKRFEAGIQVLQEALTFAVENNDVINEELIRFNLGFIDVHLGQYEQGLSAMRNVVEKARGKWSNSELEMLLGEYAEALTMASRHQQANAILTEQRQLRESVFNTELQKNVTELQNLYDSKDKAQQIELLQRQKELSDQLLENERQQQVILILGVVVALLLTALAFYLYRAAHRSNQALKQANAQLADQSLRDPLTGLLNRRAMQQELQRQEREQQPSNDAMVLLDIDYFKRINDHHGHSAGDEVIRAVAQRLLDVCRDNDKVIRWGGEEFLIYLKNTDKKALPRFVLRMLKAIAGEPIKTEKEALPVTATAGFISYPFADLNQAEMDWEATLQLVDKALYAGKVHGRNQAWGIVSLNVPFAQAHQVLDTDLAKAIEQNLVSAITLHGPRHNT